MSLNILSKNDPFDSKCIKIKAYQFDLIILYGTRYNMREIGL